MLKNKNNLIVVFFLISFLLFPWIINSSSENIEFPQFSEDSLVFYQNNICKISFYQFLKINQTHDYQIILDTTADMKCFGKLNGADFINEKFVIYLGTNINYDLLIQSSFWLLLIWFIPKSKKFEIKNKNINILIITSLTYMHLLSEQQFYSFYTKSFSNNINESYTIFSLLITMFLFLKCFIYLIEDRFYNLIYYFPFIFVVAGTYNSLNLNFYILGLSLIGIVAINKSNFLKTISIFYLALTFFWTNLISTNLEYFDVDKLKGFSSSAYNKESIVFWSIIYFLSICGFINLIKLSSDNFKINKFKNILLTSGGYVVAFSLFSTVNPIFNFLTYYYLGLNKSASKTFESVAGNAWRGISPSAETIGEFFMFIIIFTIFTNKIYIKNKFNLLEIFLLLVSIFGLYRSNNFSAFLSGIFIMLIFFAFIFLKDFKYKTHLSILLFSLLPLLIFTYINTYTIEESSRKLIKEGLEISFVDNLNTNEIGLTPIDENRFLEFLINQKENRDNVSKSLEYLIEKYHFSERNNFPNLTSTISTIATPVNRSEKWGIFFGKYNPSIQSFLLGTGSNNLSNYYLSHPTKINDGLVLPHSTILSYLVFFGLIGILIFATYILFLIIKFRNNLFFVLINLFTLINLLKNDSLLYANSFLLFIFIINFYKIDFEKIQLDE